MIVYLISAGIVTCLSLVGFVALRIRGNRIRSSTHDPRVVEQQAKVNAPWEVVSPKIRAALDKIASEATSFDASQGAYIARTPANLRTWGQFVQVSQGAEKGEQCTLICKSWPTRDLQTIDSGAGGRKAIRAFLRQLSGDNPDFEVGAN